MDVGLASAFGFESLGDVMVVGLELIFLFTDHFDLVVEPGPELGAVAVIFELNGFLADEITGLVGYMLVDYFHCKAGVLIDGPVEELAKVEIKSLAGHYCGLAFGLAIHGLVRWVRFGFGG